MSINFKNILLILLIVSVVLLIPFSVESASVYGVEVKTYNAVIYTVVRIEAFGFARTQVYFFPENIDARNNLYAFANMFGGRLVG